MQERTRLFLTAILILPLAISWTEHESVAATECITKPNAPPPQGSHWYYRTDRSINQKCWYLGPAGAKLRTATPQTTATQLPTPKPKSQSEEEKPDIAATSEPAAINTASIEGDSMAKRDVNPSSTHGESLAWGPASTTASAAGMNSTSFVTENDSLDRTAPPFAQPLAQPAESTAAAPASMATAYAEEENTTTSGSDEAVAWPITAAPVGSNRQPEPIIASASLLIAFLAVLGLVIVTVRMIGGSIVRPLRRTFVGRHAAAPSDVSTYERQFLYSAVNSVGASRNSSDEKPRRSTDPDNPIEASVQRLLRELEQRRHHVKPDGVEWPTQ